MSTSATPAIVRDDTCLRVHGEWTLRHADLARGVVERQELPTGITSVDVTAITRIDGAGAAHLVHLLDRLGGQVPLVGEGVAKGLVELYRRERWKASSSNGPMA